MSDMVRVPAEKIAALREAVEQESMQLAWNAALAVVDAVETEDEPTDKCACGHPKSIHQKDLGFCMDPAPFHRTCRCNGYTPAASPARDDAEWQRLAESTSLSAFDTVARATAFPDVVNELTALRERIRALADEWEAFPNHDTLHLCARDLRRLLGDA